MQLSENFWAMVEHFMKVVHAETGFPVVVYDDQGVIVRATDQTRIGDRHAGAEKIMQGLADEYAVRPEEAARNPLVREGYNCPIVLNDRRVAAFGITGELGQTKPLAKVAVRLIHSWIKDQEHQEQLARSEHKFHSIFDHSPQGIFQTTPEGRLLTANKALAKMYGYPRPEALLAEMTDVAHQLYVDPEDYRRLLAQLQDAGHVNGFPTRYRRSDGDIIDVNVYAHFVTEPQTGGHLVEGIVEDVTSRKRAEEALKLSEAKYFKAFNNSPVLVVLSVLETGRYIEVNETFEQTMEYSRDEIIGRTSLEIDSWVDPADRRRIQAAIQTEGCIRGYEVNRRTKSGRILTVLFFAEIIDVAGEACMLSVSLDISERKQTEENLRLSENNLRITLDSIGDAVITTDADHCVIEWNPGAVQMFGYTAQEARGRTLDSLVARGEEAHREVLQSTQRVIAGKRVAPFETTRYRKDGTLFNVIAAGSPIMDEDRLKGIVYVYTDISALKQAETRLKISHERFLTVLESIDANINVIDMETFEILYMNKRMQVSFGADLTGRICYEAFRNESDQCAVCPNAQLIDAEGNPLKRHTWEDQNPLNARWYVNHDRAIQWVDGRIVRLQVATDISEQKEIETERKEYEAQIQQMQKMEAMGVLAGGIAHDFNNILSAVIGFAELAMIDTAADSRIFNNLQQIHAAGMRARELVQQILTFSRQDEKELRPLQIGSQVKEALKMLRSSLPTTIEMRVDIAKRIDNVMADPTQIHQIVMNLCTNAAQEMEAQGGCLTVRLEQVTLKPESVRLRPGLQAGDYVRLSVQDTGQGIPAQILDKIFTPYFTTKEKYKGTGLGLAVVHGIVQSYGGDIQVASTVGQGATFNIYLPSIKAAAEAPPQQVSLPMGLERILLVDDEAFIVEFGRQGLERLGYRVEGFTSGIDALKHFRQAPERYDLVVTDMTMPKITGDQLAQEIFKVRQNMPVILCTGYSSLIDVNQAEKMGIRAMLMKPLNLSDLALNIRRVLDASRRKRRKK